MKHGEVETGRRRTTSRWVRVSPVFHRMRAGWLVSLTMLVILTSGCTIAPPLAERDYQYYRKRYERDKRHLEELRAKVGSVKVVRLVVRVVNTIPNDSWLDESSVWQAVNLAGLNVATPDMQEIDATLVIELERGRSGARYRDPVYGRLSDPNGGPARGKYYVTGTKVTGWIAFEFQGRILYADHIHVSSESPWRTTFKDLERRKSYVPVLFGPRSLLAAVLCTLGRVGRIDRVEACLQHPDYRIVRPAAVHALLCLNQDPPERAYGLDTVKARLNEHDRMRVAAALERARNEPSTQALVRRWTESANRHNTRPRDPMAIEEIARQ